MPSIKILVDHSVRQDALIEEHRVELAEAQFLGRTYHYLRPVTLRRPPRSDWRQSEIDLLPKIAGLIREGHVEAFTTNELEAEYFRAAKAGVHFTDIFEGCRFGFLPAPFDRSKWGLSIEQHCSKEDVISYCECFFLTPSEKRTEQFIEGMKRNPSISLTPFEERCLRRAHAFKSICHGIDRTHYPDALHLWTAEENGMDAFLTHDKRFINVIAHQKAKLHCTVILPSSFLGSLCA